MDSRSDAGPATTPRTRGVAVHGPLVPWLAVAWGTAFALYWVSNLLLWIPWSFSETLGIALMLTVSPLIWAAGSAFALARWDGPSIWKGATWTASILLGTAVASDLIFFGALRGAIEELLRPSTFAGYAWVVVLPYLVVPVRRHSIALRARRPTVRAAVIPAVVGLVALVLLLILVASTT